MRQQEDRREHRALLVRDGQLVRNLTHGQHDAISDVVAGRRAHRFQPRPAASTSSTPTAATPAARGCRALRHSAELGSLTLRRAGALTALALEVLLAHAGGRGGGDFLGKWGTSGTGDGSPRRSAASRPTGTATSSRPTRKGRIEKFTTAGGFVRSIGAPPSPVEKIDEIQSPEGVAVGPNGISTWSSPRAGRVSRCGPGPVAS